MRTGLTYQQSEILNANVKNAYWLFEITLSGSVTPDYFWSTVAHTYNSQAYTFKIMGFDSLKLDMGSPESGVIPPTQIGVKVSLSGSVIDGNYASDFEGASVTVRLVCGADMRIPAAPGDEDEATAEYDYQEVEIMAWRFKILSSTSVDQIMFWECQDFFTIHLEGDYPNTPLVSDLFRADIMKADNVCVPLAFGNPFFPVRWIPYYQDALYVSSTIFDVMGDKTALFSVGQFVLASCGTDGSKAGWVDSVALENYDLIVRRNGVDNPYAYAQLTAELGATYRVSVYAKKIEEASVRACFTDALASDGDYEDAEAPDDWGTSPTITFDSVATSTTMYIKLAVITSNATDGTRFDFLQIRKVNSDGSLGPTIVTNGHFSNTLITPWVAGNSATMSRSSTNGITCTKVTLTAASADLTANLTTIQTDHYLLGESGITYTIDRARTPTEQNGKSTYLPASYTFKQDTVTGSDAASYRVVQLLCDDANKDGTNDANGFWGIVGKEIYDMPLRFSRSDLATMTSPPNIAEYIFEAWGIPSAEIDAVSQAAAAATYAARGVELAIGLWYRHKREELISKLFSVCGMIPIYRDTIGFKVLTKTPQLIIEEDMIKPGSFQVSRLGYTTGQTDSGYVTWQVATEPVDQVNKVLVAAKTTTAKKSDTVIECDWMQDAAKAQKAGKLALQRSLLREQTVAFTAQGKILVLEPGDMITIPDANNGAGAASYDCMITKMTIHGGLWVDVECVRFSDALDDWDDLSASDIVVADAILDKAYTPVYQGQNDASAAAGTGTNVITQTVQIGAGGILATNDDPATNGGFKATNEDLTCYNTSGAIRFQAIYSGTDQGDVIFGDYAGGQGIKWDQSASLLKIKVTEAGGIEVAGGGDITLTGSDTDPGLVKFSGTSYAVEIGGDADGNRFIIKPTTNNVVDLRISDPLWWGGSDLRFRDVFFFGTRQGGMSFGDFSGAVNGAAVEIDGDSSDAEPRFDIALYDKTSETLRLYYFRHGYFAPFHHKTQDSGTAANAWDDVYADDFQNVADFLWLDHRQAGGKLVPVDDIAIIRGIKPSGNFDPDSGLEIIDDDTLPKWILSKCKKTGDILKDPKGKPYLSLRVIISLLMGAIRQLDKQHSKQITELKAKIEAIEKKNS